MNPILQSIYPTHPAANIIVTNKTIKRKTIGIPEDEKRLFLIHRLLNHLQGLNLVLQESDLELFMHDPLIELALYNFLFRHVIECFPSSQLSLFGLTHVYFYLPFRFFQHFVSTPHALVNREVLNKWNLQSNPRILKSLSEHGIIY